MDCRNAGTEFKQYKRQRQITSKIISFLIASLQLLYRYLYLQTVYILLDELCVFFIYLKKAWGFYNESYFEKKNVFKSNESEMRLFNPKFKSNNYVTTRSLFRKLNTKNVFKSCQNSKHPFARSVNFRNFRAVFRTILSVNFFIGFCFYRYIVACSVFCMLNRI